MKKTVTFVSILLMVIFTNSTNGQDFITATQSDNGKTVHLLTDQVLEIQLPRKASTGYIWCLSDTDAKKSGEFCIALAGDDEFIQDPDPVKINGNVLAGQSGKQIIRYTGKSQGVATLSLELKRPWEKNQPAIDSFALTIISDGKYLGNYVPPVKTMPEHTTSTPKNLPSHFDWRPYCTPIKDQQQCGDCWAFAGVGTLECNIKIVDGITRDISEAYVTNCYTLSLGCNGGLCPHELWVAPKGAVYESDYPWTPDLANGISGSCGGPYPYHETVDSYANVPGANLLGMPPDANIKSAIYNNGPVWVDVCASSSAWSNYTGGIYTGNGLIFNHCVVLVGWCDSTSVTGGGYWILRNSWGSDWGMGGYMYISYGSDVVGLFANYIVYKGGTLQNFLNTANQENDKIKIYPVPATDNLRIETIQDAVIEIFNEQGQEVKSITAGSGNVDIDISGFVRGIYIIKAKSDQGVWVRKFVKE